jgi:hypothetical protein
LNKGGAKCADAPQDEGCSDGLFGAPSPGSQDPRNLKDNGTDAGQCLNITKLAILETDVFIETKDPSIAKLVGDELH